jgi:hypothetical protein
MLLDAMPERLYLGAALALLICGAVAAFISSNFAKRLIGQALAMAGAITAAAALAAPEALMISAAAVMLAYIAVGAAVLVRVQEAYGSIEADEADRADADSDTPEQAP